MDIEQDTASSNISFDSALSSVSQYEEKVTPQILCQLVVIELKFKLVLQFKMEFFSDWERGVSGSIGKGGIHHVLNDFAMKLKFIVNAGVNTG